MAKYYVITAGSYSDYHIVHITTDKKLAETYVKLHDHKDYDSDGMAIEEFDDLIDQCNIQDMFDEASVLHPYLRIYVLKSGLICNETDIRYRLINKNSDNFIWKEGDFEEVRINEVYPLFHFEMVVQVDKYDYNYDKIVKVVMDTRAKILAEKEGL